MEVLRGGEALLDRLRLLDVRALQRHGLREHAAAVGGVTAGEVDDLAAIQEGFAALLAPYLEDGGEGKHRVSLATVLLPEPPSAASTQD